MPAQKPPVVFYSWQSDLPNKTNRGLIEDALVKACKELSADLELAIRVDADIQGESGSPDIAATILDKIDKATVVVADVSIIGVAPITGGGADDKRAVPNPNVMFELGYARHSLGSKRVIMICNTSYGKIEELPFDIRGKGVVGYSFKADEGEKPAGPRNDLAGKLKAAVAAALEAANEKSNVLDAQTEEQVKQAQVEAFQALRARLNDALINAGSVRLVATEPLIVLHIAPAVSLDGATRVDLKAAKTNLVSELSPLGATGWKWDYDVDSITGLHAQKEDHPEHWTFTRLYDTGVIELVVSLSGNELNSVTYTAVRALAHVLPMIEKLGLQGRCLVSLDVLRAKGTSVSTKGQMLPPGRTGRVIEKADLHPPPAIAEAPKPADAPSILRPALDWLWKAAGFEGCWYYDDHGRLLPP